MSSKRPPTDPRRPRSPAGTQTPTCDTHPVHTRTSLEVRCNQLLHRVTIARAVRSGLVDGRPHPATLDLRKDSRRRLCALRHRDANDVAGAQLSRGDAGDRSVCGGCEEAAAGRRRACALCSEAQPCRCAPLLLQVWGCQACRRRRAVLACVHTCACGVWFCVCVATHSLRWCDADGLTRQCWKMCGGGSTHR
jgi:hypothetical protein